jgi:hypothetical protein
VSIGPINAPALAELCALLETPGQQLLPDAVGLGGRAALYQRLRECEALSLAPDLAPEVLCPDCREHKVRPQPLAGAPGHYQALCFECGEVELPKEQVRLWQAQPGKVADWLHQALALRGRHTVTELIPGVLWHLGELEIRRHRRSFFFGCRLDGDPVRVRAKLGELAAPSAEAVITTTETAVLSATPLADCRLIALPAVAQLRKGHLTLEPLDAYFDGLAPPVTSDETSLRLLHRRRAVLIGGVEHKLSPQVYDFLKVLEDAEGDEVHKRQIAQALGIAENFRYADIKKRHKLVFDTFVQSDAKGHFWLRPEFLILERG